MRVALGQIDPWVGDLSGNVSLVLEGCRRAIAANAQIAVFPELVVTGYPPRDLLNVTSFIDQTEAAVDRIVGEIPDGLVVIFGAPRRRQRNATERGGRALCNSAIACRRGEILLEVQKALLPTYDVFDERRYFEPADVDVQRVFEACGEKIGISICEDMWNDAELWGENRFYDRDPIAETVAQGATLLINISASPFAQGKHRTRRNLVRHAAQRWQVPVVYVNSIGGNDGLLFDGGSIACARDGNAIVELPLFESSLEVVDLAARTALIEPAAMDVLGRALIVGVRDYAKKTGISRWIVGLSGGIDSALVACIGTLALGAEHGMAFSMPSRYSSEHSVDDARILADKLHLPFRVVPIEAPHRAYEEALAPVLQPRVALSDVTFENVQARIRGAMLMAYANREGALLLTTGNKSECSVGYCTLYGDTCGGLAVIADLWKHEVYALSRHLNAHQLAGVIPESTLIKPPSAELRPGQRDDQSLPPYDVLDPILKALVEDELGVDDAAKASGQPVELVREMAGKLFRAEYKRKQFAPTLKVSGRAWVGRDYPIAIGWRP